MPVYEYQCLDCGSQFEMSGRISDPTLPACPACHGGHTRKRVSLSTFQLKGSGWYATDYGRKGGNGGSDSHPHKDNGKGKDEDVGKDKEDKPATCPTAGTGKKDKEACASCPSASSCDD
jgi:putative FmdB family regulatory protein